MLLIAGWFVFRVPDIPVATLRARYASSSSRFVTIAPGLTVHLRDEGQKGGLPIVLLHGSNASLQTWDPWVARLGGRYRFVSVDLPGHGLTGAAPDGDYSQAAYARVLDAVIAERKLGRFVLVGHSMGGGVAALYASEHPDRIAALILVDASGEPYPKGSGGTPLLMRVLDLPGVRDAAAQLTPRWMIAQSLDGAVAVKQINTPAAIDRYWDLLRYPGNRVATIERFAQGYAPVPPAALARITAPTLILWGKEDQFIPVASAAYFDRAIPDSRAIIYPGVGHLVMEEAPDRSAGDVRAFLARLPAGPA
ncbi:alpha/beta hydrolase [Sphingomonas koreensis]|nr:alpha/beta hydrolase [Sphingomonas koreensis]